MITFFIINCILSTYTIVPFFRAKCNCSTYFQCQVLYNFATGEQPGEFKNPRNIEEPGWMEPEDCNPNNGICTTSFGTEVHVKYTEQPQKRTESSFMQEGFTARSVEPKAHDLVPKSAGLFSDDRWRHLGPNHARVHNSRKTSLLRFAAAGQLRMLDAGDSLSRGNSTLKITTAHKSGKLGLSQSVLQHTVASQRSAIHESHIVTRQGGLISKATGMQKSANFKEVEKLYNGGAMDVFHYGSAKIEWRQRKGKPECQNVSWSSLPEFENVLPDFWEKKKEPRDIGIEVHPAFADLNRKLQQCWSLPNCMVVSVAKKKQTGNDGNGNVEICCFMRHTTPTVFDPGHKPEDKEKKGFPDDIADYVKVVANFEKRTKEINKLGRAYMTTEQVYNEIEDSFKGECRCKRDDNGYGGCMASLDPSTRKPSYWCYVENVAACERQENAERSFDIDIYHTADGQAWTKDLCNTDCKCQDVGVPPVDGEKVDKELMWENGANYGASCKAWTTTEPRKWCYVGFDSKCSDRELSDVRQGWGFQLYWSRIACMDDHTPFSGPWLLNHFSSKCKIFSYTGWLWQALILLLMPPVVFMSFKFVNNRCGDAIEDSEARRFVVESDDEDDFVYSGPDGH